MNDARRMKYQKGHDGEHRAGQVLYWTPRWRAIRKYQLAMNPSCEWCAKKDINRGATVCHHVVPHRGDEVLFHAGPFVSLCKECHDAEAHEIDMNGYTTTRGSDGWPVDSNHPSNR